MCREGAWRSSESSNVLRFRRKEQFLCQNIPVGPAVTVRGQLHETGAPISIPGIRKV